MVTLSNIDPFNLANFRGNRSNGVCCPNSTSTLSTCPFLFFFLSSPTTITTRRISAIYSSNDADLPKDVPFEGFDDKNIVHCIKTPRVSVVRQLKAKSKKKIKKMLYSEHNKSDKREIWGALKTIRIIPRNQLSKCTVADSRHFFSNTKTSITSVVDGDTTFGFIGVFWVGRHRRG